MAVVGSKSPGPLETSTMDNDLEETNFNLSTPEPNTLTSTDSLDLLYSPLVSTLGLTMMMTQAPTPDSKSNSSKIINPTWPVMVADSNTELDMMVSIEEPSNRMAEHIDSGIKELNQSGTPGSAVMVELEGPNLKTLTSGVEIRNPLLSRARPQCCINKGNSNTISESKSALNHDEATTQTQASSTQAGGPGSNAMPILGPLVAPAPTENTVTTKKKPTTAWRPDSKKTQHTLCTHHWQKHIKAGAGTHEEFNGYYEALSTETKAKYKEEAEKLVKDGIWTKGTADVVGKIVGLHAMY
ncbi:hypothetical protein JVU11DRAFT_3969 [Chiua virens]|nr:hypothetical protein JVU11DRAFT_3969 [Chiua virens]